MLEPEPVDSSLMNPRHAGLNNLGMSHGASQYLCGAVCLLADLLDRILDASARLGISQRTYRRCAAQRCPLPNKNSDGMPTQRPRSRSRAGRCSAACIDSSLWRRLVSTYQGHVHELTCPRATWIGNANPTFAKFGLIGQKT